MARFESERLLLRSPFECDAETLRAYNVRNRDRFERWNPPRPCDVESYVAWIGELAPPGNARGTVFLAFENLPHGALVAEVILAGFSTMPPSAMLGYTVDAAFEGRGYASEAVAAVVAHAFDVLALERITANYDPENVRSERLLQRVGFELVGHTPVVPGFERLMRANAAAVLTRARAAR